MSENPKCPYCGNMMDIKDADRLWPYKVYWYACDNCGATSPYANSANAAEAAYATMKRYRVKGSMSLYIYKKLGEWFGAPCNLSFGELRVDDFFTRYCGDFCDDCNSEYEKCWKKFFETLEEAEANDE